MKNSDMPASPIMYMDQTNGSGELYCENIGLTKREYFAAKALQGMLADNRSNRVDIIAASSVMFADALLKALEE